MHSPPEPPVKRRRGNPNMRIGGPSVNPGGRPKSYPELRALCQEKTIAGVERMYEILNDPQQPGSTRVAAWVALRDTGFDRPAQRIAFNDYTNDPAGELPKDADVHRMADLYALMIGAEIGSGPPIIDVIPTPTPSRSLPAPHDEPELPGARLQRIRQPLQEAQVEARAPRPQPRLQRVRRPRRRDDNI